MRARQGRDGDARARETGIGADAWRGGGPARLGTVVSCLTARAARPPPGGHAQIRGSPLPFVVETKAPGRGTAPPNESAGPLGQWSIRDSNPGPLACEASALTS